MSEPAVYAAGLPNPKAPEPDRVRYLFDRLADGYDAFNSLASLGMDRFWRGVLLHQLAQKASGTVLDLGTGTGDLIFEALKAGPRPDLCIGVDLSIPMMLKASAKCGSAAEVCFVQSSAGSLPLASGTVDAVVSAFVLRNVKKLLPEVLSEVFRVLKPGGRVFFLDMYVPDHWALKRLHGLYLRTVLPAAGRAVFGSRWSGDYLPETIFHFVSPVQLSESLRRAGFQDVSSRSLSGGIAALHIARK